MDILKNAFRHLIRKRSRTFLTMLGIIVGVGSVVVVNNIGSFGTELLNDELDSMGLDGITVSVAENETGETFLKEKDLELVRSSRNIACAMPILVENSIAIVRSFESTALLWGIDENAGEIVKLECLFGRLISPYDVKSGTRVCLVDEEFANSAYHRSDIVGKEIIIGLSGSQEKFTVIGVVKTGGGLLQNVIGNYVPNFIYVPYTTFQQMKGRTDFDRIAVKVESGKDARDVGESLQTTLDRANGTSDSYISNNLATQRGALLNILSIVRSVLTAIGGVSLLVSGLGIMTVMLVSVGERTREIGIKKSIGARRSVILSEFLTEAVLITAVGSLIGAALGSLISFAGVKLLGLTVTDYTGGGMLFLILFVSVFSGIIFGVYPAIKASGLAPAEAFKTE